MQPVSMALRSVLQLLQSIQPSACTRQICPSALTQAISRVEQRLYSSASTQEEPDATVGPTSMTNKSRFYKSVRIEQDAHGHYQVMLDGRPVKTPGKHILALPSQALALALAAEWDWQTSGRPQMHSMPLMSLAATALDQPKPREKVIESLLKYVHTDATCCRVENTRVANRQAEVHDPLLHWSKHHLGWSLQPSDDLFSPPPPQQTVESVKHMLEGLDSFQLAAMEQLTATCKSVVIAAAVLHNKLSPQEAMKAARVEEDCQIEEWGSVEAGHDLDIADITTRIYAPSLFLRLLSYR